MDNHSKASLPLLKANHEFPSYKRNFLSYLASEGCSSVIQLHWKAPIGLVLQSLREFPTLRNRLMDLEELEITEAKPASGSKAWKALHDEIINNPCDAVYDAIESKIEMFSQGSKQMPIYLKELNDLFSQLPTKLAYSESKKIRILRTGVHKDYEMFLKALHATPAITYDLMCSSLLTEHHNQEVITQGKASALTESNKHALAQASESDDAANFVDYKRQRGHGRGQDRRYNRDYGQYRPKQPVEDKVKVCYNCNKPGHFANKCRAPKSFGLESRVVEDRGGFQGRGSGGHNTHGDRDGRGGHGGRGRGGR